MQSVRLTRPRLNERAAVVAAGYALSGNPAGPAFSYAHRGQFRTIGGGRFLLETGLGSPHGVAGL